MLELRNVTKIYHSKSGNDVRALNNVSVSFPETGMVFILGKSGCGKSTLLNVIGGLDGCDEGEFIIKGKSSKDFGGSDFDAYRNTFIGFIFQEYNILDEFSVGANIALALELQGKKATSEQINAILEQVGMLEYANRKPNELSGGQKQRIAIARALVKDPEIIMADEPTGALDSNTGKQIFDTLKALSKSKLVIIVSHDRDFAEIYGDRIIEMKDGVIISDVTKHHVDAKSVSSGILMMNDNLLKIEKGYQLTAKDVELINEYLRNRENDVIVSADARVNDSVRNAAGISSDNKSAVFKETDAASDIKTKKYDGKETSFIRSRLPMKNAVKMGSSSLGHKKVRLVFTIFLSLIAFALFGFADTMGSYDKVTATTQSIIDSGVKNASFTVGVREEGWSKDKLEYVSYPTSSFNDNDVSLLNNKLGMTFTPVYNGSSDVNRMINISENFKSTQFVDNSTAYRAQLSGFVNMDKTALTNLGYEIHGEMPISSDQIAISKFIYEQFKANGYRNGGEEISAENLNMTPGAVNSIIGQKITMRVGMGEYTYTITAVIDTRFEYDRYRDYIPDTTSNGGNQQSGSDDMGVMDMVMGKELDNTLQYGYHCLGYVTKDALNIMSETMERWHFGSAQLGEEMYWNPQLKNDATPDNSLPLSRVGKSELIPQLDIAWLGTSKTQLGENELLISSSFFNNFNGNGIDVTAKVQSFLTKYESKYNSAETNLSSIITSIARYDNGGSEPTYEQKAVIYNEFAKELLGVDLKKDYTNLSSERICEIVSNLANNISSGGKDEESGYKLHTHTVTNFVARLTAYNEVYAADFVIPNATGINKLIAEWGGMKVDDYLQLSDAEKLPRIAEYYSMTLNNNGEQTFSYGKSTYNDVYKKSLRYMVTLIGSGLNGYYISLSYWNDGNENTETLRDFNIVGIIMQNQNDWSTLVISDRLYNKHIQLRDDLGYYYYKYAPHEAGIYSFVIAPMPTSEADIRKLVELGYTEEGDVSFSLQNQVTNSLEFFNEFIEMGSKIFIYVGLGFALFAALMMMNFISTSITYKRREIGILRAVGARSSDVFKIFFSEALIIAIINYIFSIIATIVAVNVLNGMVRNEGINVTLLNFGIRQIILMLLISVFVAALASFLPVWNIAKRKPVDAIKNT